MATYQQDRQWSDKFIPELKQIVADLLIAPAPTQEDAFHNTDLIVLGVEAKRVACRVRRFHYYKTWPNDITIRSTRPNGKETELAKMIAGYGDYFIYAFAREDESGLYLWRIINLADFRKWFMAQLVKLPEDVLPGMDCFNGDGSSKFRAFDVNNLMKFSPTICHTGKCD